MNALDITMFQALAAGQDPSSWALMLGRGLALWGAWLGAGVLCWAAWRRPAEWPYLCAVAAAAGIASLLSHTIALSLDMPRPFMLNLAPAWIDHGGRGSLPSTHASVMFTIAIALLCRPALRTAGWALLALAALTGWARIYVGVHFPVDIAAGIVLAGVVVAGLRAGRWALHQVVQRQRGDDTRASPWRRS